MQFLNFLTFTVMHFLITRQSTDPVIAIYLFKNKNWEKQ